MASPRCARTWRPLLLSCSVHSFITYSLWSGEQTSGAIARMDVRKLDGKHLKNLRVASGHSQEELADKAGIHQTYLSGVEGGKRNPSIMVLQRIADGLGVDVVRLFER